MGDTCKGPECERPAEVGELCTAHYQQQRRAPGEPLRALRTPPGEGDRVNFRLPRELREAAAEDAKREDVEEGEWWRRAGVERLERKGKR